MSQSSINLSVCRMEVVGSPVCMSPGPGSRSTSLPGTPEPCYNGDGAQPGLGSKSLGSSFDDPGLGSSDNTEVSKFP